MENHKRRSDDFIPQDIRIEYKVLYGALCMDHPENSWSFFLQTDARDSTIALMKRKLQIAREFSQAEKTFFSFYSKKISQHLGLYVAPKVYMFGQANHTVWHDESEFKKYKYRSELVRRNEGNVAKRELDDSLCDRTFMETTK